MCASLLLVSAHDAADPQPLPAGRAVLMQHGARPMCRMHLPRAGPVPAGMPDWCTAERGQHLGRHQLVCCGRVGEAAAQAAQARVAALEDDNARLALELGSRPTLGQLRRVQWQLAALKPHAAARLPGAGQLGTACSGNT